MDEPQAASAAPPPPEATVEKPSIPVWREVLIGFALTFCVFVAATFWEQDRLRLAFDAGVEQRFFSIRQALGDTLEAVTFTKGLYLASMEVDTDEFHAFTAPVVARHPGIQALEWIPRVPDVDRIAFESSAFPIVERSRPGTMVPAAKRDVYYPVHHLEPLGGNEAALGFDLGSEPARLAALEKARDEATAIATRRLTLVQEKNSEFGFLVFEPVYRKGGGIETLEERRRNLLGFVLGVFRVGDIVRASLADGRAGEKVFLFDEDAPPGEQRLFPRESRFEAASRVEGDFCVARGLDAADRRWTVVVCADPKTGMAFYWTSWLFLLVGLSVTALVAVRRWRMERRLTEGTAALLRANRSLRTYAEEIGRLDLRNRTILESIGEGIYGVDMDGRATFMNPAAVRMLGYDDPKALIGVLQHELFHHTRPDGSAHPAAECPILASCRDGEVHRVTDDVFWRRDGTAFPVEYLSTPRTENGRIVGAVVVFRDISARRTAEREIAEKTVFIDNILRSSTDMAIAATDLDFRILYFNPAAERIFGHPAEEVIGMTVMEIHEIEKVDPARFEKAVAIVRETGEYRYEVVQKNADGDRVISSRVSGVWGRDGGLSGFVLMSRDVTEARRAEERIRLSEERFRSLSESVTDAIVAADGAGAIVSWNPGARALFGYEAAEIIGRPLTAIIPEAYRAAHSAGLERVRAEGPGNSRVIGHVTEFQGLRKDGTTFPMELSLGCWKAGDELFFSGVIRDIAGRKEAEAALAKASEELRRSNADLQQFAYMASHDLQEPLRMITSFLQLLARKYEGRLDKDANEYIDFAVAGAKRMNALIRDLLAFSRIDTKGREAVPVDMNRVVDDVLQNLKVSIDEADARVAVGSLPVLYGDEAQLLSLLQNVIGNSVKYRHPGRAPEIQVAADRKDGEWIFSVSDNGIGIAHEHFDRVFQVFQRLHARDEYEGTGIGLAVAKRIVERHGGRIWVESAPGEGSTFFFSLREAAEGPRAEAIENRRDRQ